MEWMKWSALAGAMVLAVACGDDEDLSSTNATSTSGSTTGSGAGGASSGATTGSSTTGSSTTGSSSTGGGGGATSSSGAGGGGVGGSSGCDVPSNATALEAFFTANGYNGWAAESAVHASTGPHGMVRTFVNTELAQSLTASNASHPVCAASIKELYQNDGTTLLGYAVMVKVTNGTSGNDWYWYERIGNNVVADGTGVGGCTGCHSAGTDYFRSPFPLQ